MFKNVLCLLLNLLFPSPLELLSFPLPLHAPYSSGLSALRKNKRNWLYVAQSAHCNVKFRARSRLCERLIGKRQNTVLHFKTE